MIGVKTVEITGPETSQEVALTISMTLTVDFFLEKVEVTFVEDGPFDYNAEGYFLENLCDKISILVDNEKKEYLVFTLAFPIPISVMYRFVTLYV